MNFREKHQERRPRDLHDISHLFLSSAAPAASTACARALVAVAGVGDGPWRAFTAAGLARALAAAGLDVTLLETGRALPNAGYYFALEPAAYLRPVLDPRAVVSGPGDGSIRFHYARDQLRLPLPPREGQVPGRARIVLFAFDRSAAGERSAVPARFHDLLCAASEQERGSGDAGERTARRVALVTAGPDSDDGYLGRMQRSFEDAFPGAPCFPIQGAEVPAGIARRSPPSLELFGGIAAQLLQRLARGREEARG